MSERLDRQVAIIDPAKVGWPRSLSGRSMEDFEDFLGKVLGADPRFATQRTSPSGLD